MKKKQSSRRGLSINLLSIGLAIGSVFAATAIVIPLVEKGSGAVSKPECLSNAIVDFETSMQGNLTGVSVTGLSSDCANRWIRLSIFTSSDGTGTAAEQIVWQMPSPTTPPATSYTARADGSTTGASGSVVWPTSEAGAAGLAATRISSSSANSFTLETSESSLTDGP